MKLHSLSELSRLIRNIGVSRDSIHPSPDDQLRRRQLDCRLPSAANWRIGILAALISTLATLSSSGRAQTSLPFEVSNPKHLNWSTEEADRIYSSACELVARSIRPEKPPRLEPKFVLVLGADADETVRDGTKSEVHLKKWNPAHFAEAVVLMATREILKREDVSHLTHDTLVAAGASVSVNELRRKK